MRRTLRFVTNLRRKRWFWLYVGLMLASNLVVAIWNPSAIEPPDPMRLGGGERFNIDVPKNAFGDSDAGGVCRVSGVRWGPEVAESVGAPVVLLHGSPSSLGAKDWSLFAPELAEKGRTVIALDRPGYGMSEPSVASYSPEAQGCAVLATMNELGMDRAHVVGWSYSGVIGLRMAERAPERIASLTLLAAIAAQETEGSGEYYFEHAKYAALWMAAVAAPEVVPHFGLLGRRASRRAFAAEFWQLDQRPFAELMGRIETPTLILHGRDDFLVPAWGAQRHHELMPKSSLVMLDASHFIPFRDGLEEGARHLRAFLEKHDDPEAPVVRSAVDYTVARGEGPAQKLGPLDFSRDTPWLMLVAFIVLATFLSEDATVITVGVLVAHGGMDFGVGLVGCFVGIVLGDGGLWILGRVFGRRALRWPILRAVIPEASLERWGRWFDRNAVSAVLIARAAPGLRMPTYFMAGMLSRKARSFLFWAILAALVWTPMLLILAAIVGPGVGELFHGVVPLPVAMLLTVGLLLILVRVVESACTYVGRRKLLRTLVRPVRSEFWPVWFFYAPLVPWLILLAFRYRGATVFTCVNQGVPHGGGIVGESKEQILSGFSPDAQRWVLPSRLVRAGGKPELRADTIDRFVREDETLGGYPVVLKPDQAQRGHAVKLVADAEGVLAYCRAMTRDVQVQAYDTSPKEVGVLWVRGIDAAGKPEERGKIFSITRKEFPVIIGDGKRTLERLIWSHPRFRMQAEVFLQRFTDRSDLVLGKDTQMALGMAGNHCQGTTFLEGADLITPELSQRIDEISRSFRTDGGGLDFGRYDLRYTSDEELRRGDGFKIVELNGAMSESTNLYDPRRSVFWSYGVLFRQWAKLYELGAARQRTGARGLMARELIASLRDHYRGRSGSSVSD